NCATEITDCPTRRLSTLTLMVSSRINLSGLGCNPFDSIGLAGRSFRILNFSVTIGWLLEIGSWLLEISYWLLAVGCWPGPIGLPFSNRKLAIRQPATARWVCATITKVYLFARHRLQGRSARRRRRQCK